MNPSSFHKALFQYNGKMNYEASFLANEPAHALQDYNGCNPCVFSSHLHLGLNVPKNDAAKLLFLFVLSIKVLQGHIRIIDEANFTASKKYIPRLQYRVAMPLNCFNLQKNLSTRFRSL